MYIYIYKYFDLPIILPVSELIPLAIRKIWFCLFIYRIQFITSNILLTSHTITQ